VLPTALYQQLPLFRSEAYATLCDMAEERSGRIPPAVLAAYVLEITGGGDWPVSRACLAAILERRRPGLIPEPEGGEWLVDGERATVDSLDPMRGSCGCRDYRVSSLGVCEHVFAVMEHLWRTGTPPGRAGAARLRWDPIRPLLGTDDWMERLTIRGTPVDPGGADRRSLVAMLDALPAEPAVRALLARERKRLEAIAEAAPARARLGELLAGMKRPLFPHQVTGVDRLLARGRLLLADDMGIGKTAQAIGACHALFRAGLVERGLVVTPASLKSQWMREWRLFSDAPIAMLETRRAETYASTSRGFLLASYEQLLRDGDGWKPQLVVLDEAQRIKNRDTRTAARLRSLQPEWRLAMTGTPMENRLAELAALLEWLDEDALEPVWRLAPWHTDWRDPGVRNLGTLRARIAGPVLRRTRTEILRSLPPRTDESVTVPMTKPQLTEHERHVQKIAVLLAETRRRPMTRSEFLRLMKLLTCQRIASNGMALVAFSELWPILARRKPDREILRTLWSPKLEAFRCLIEDLVLERGRKVIVFSQWRRMLQLAEWAIRDVLEEAGRRTVWFTGRETLQRRTHSVVDFHDDDSASVFLATDAGGLGLNLQRAASCCVNLELSWNPAVMEQRAGRVHRLGQEQPVEIHTIVSAGGIEDRIGSLAQGKRELFRSLFEGTEDSVRIGNTSFMAGIRLLAAEVAG
jgi:SNF2 family DNA or RNA helicase